jgi:tetratricopeptide (TPR) repeat protein
MNAGDAAMEKNEIENAMKEYDLAMRLAEGNVEMAFWSALTLAVKGNMNRALPIFKKVFSADKNWVELLKRLPKTGMIPNDRAGRALLQRILNEAAKQ